LDEKEGREEKECDEKDRDTKGVSHPARRSSFGGKEAAKSRSSRWEKETYPPASAACPSKLEQVDLLAEELPE